MASKQLGKLRQWGKEVISSKDKTTVTEEFKQLERDVELRKAGIAKIHEACSEYHGYLHKKKEYLSIEEGVKMLPIDALGVVMVAHGEEFGTDSAFGQCLTKFGRAQCKIATLQEAFASFIRDKYLSSLQKLLDDFEIYETLRKKLDSRRLTYDAALSKASKVKKDKDLIEAEDEILKAKIRYEETSSEVQTRMRRIQANELRQLKDLTGFLDSQIQFTSKCLSELRDAQVDWYDEASIESRRGAPTSVTPHSFSHGQGRAIASVSRTKSLRSNRPPSTSNKNDPETEESDSTGAGTLSQSDGRSSRNSTSTKGKAASKTPSIGSRQSSLSRRGSISSNGTAHHSIAEPAPIRPRSNSSTSSVASSAESTKRSGGVTGWLTGPNRGKRDKDRRKDKDRAATRAFATLENDSEDEEADDDVASRKSVDSESRSNGVNTNSTTLRKGGTLSRMFSTAQRPLSMNLSIKGSSSNSSVTSYVESRDTDGSEAANNSPSLGIKKVKRTTDDFTVSGSARSSLRDGDNNINIFSDGEHPWALDGLPRTRGNTNINGTGAHATSFVSTYDADSRLLSNITVKTSIAQRAELEMQETSGYEPSINSMDDNMPTPLPIPTHTFTPFSDTHYIKRGSFLNNAANSGSEEELDENSTGLLFEQDGHKTKSIVLPTVDRSIRSQNHIETGNASESVASRGGPPPLPSRKQSVKKVPPPPPPARRSAPSPNAGLATLGGSSSSLNSSAGGTTSTGVSFPPPPPPRSRNHLIPIDSLTISPFDN